MSHQTCMSLPHKHNVLKTSVNQGKGKPKSCPTTATESRCNAVAYSIVRTSSQKLKRFKTRKERNQIRGLERNGSHAGPQHSRQVGSEKSQHHGFYQSHLVVSSKIEKTFAKPFVTQKPSIITQGRLTSIRGLFSHEIRSLDIERLVSDELKNEKQRKHHRKQVTSPLPPLPRDPVPPESDQDCALDEVQDPQQESENNALSYVKTKKSSDKGNAFQTNKEVTVHMESSKKSKKEDTNINSRPDSSNSLNGSQERWSSSANKLPYRLCSTPVKAIKIYSDFPEIDSPISPHENNKGNIEVPPNKSDPSLSELDSGTGTLTGNGSEREQISVSVREAVKKLTTRVCQTLELNVPKRSLLTECREVLLKTLQKTHSFHLQDNLRKLHSLRNGKQTDSFGSGQTHEDCSYAHFSNGVGNEDSEHRRNMEMWKDHFTQREEVKQDLDRDVSMRKRRVQAERILSSPVSIIQPLQSHTEIFDQLRTTRMSQDCFRTQHYPSTPAFRRDQYASPISSVPTWTNHPYEPGLQQLFGDSQRKCESTKNVGFDLISHQWKENTDPLFNSYYKYQNTEQKAQETFLGRSSHWSDQQVQDVRERWAPISFSTSFSSEGFRYKPYFRFPHPSNSQHGSDLLDMNLYNRSNTDSAHYHHWE
ncbi:proline-rich protein 19 [Misgurnus anguillicaudatus]|uniref:proline-rich protein 19 n=1 Tax=Misgurnus anguillicaudatus TaxID=75329 RepID=UPI003CCFBE5B